MTFLIFGWSGLLEERPWFRRKRGQLLCRSGKLEAERCNAAAEGPERVAAKGIRRDRLERERIEPRAVVGHAVVEVRTGCQTGPHLDYRVSDNGTWLDPLTLKSITPDPLRGDALGAFRSSVASLSLKLATPAQQLAAFAAKPRALF